MKENEVNDIMNFIEEDINLNDTLTKLIKMVKKRALFSKKNKKLITDPLDDNNPIIVTGIRYLFCIGNNSSAKASSSNVFFSSFVLSVTNIYCHY